MSLDAFLQTLKKSGGTPGTHGTPAPIAVCGVPPQKKPSGTPGTNLKAGRIAFTSDSQNVPPVPAQKTITGSETEKADYSILSVMPPDDRRYCRQCVSFNYGDVAYGGYCTALRERQIDDIPRRCAQFRDNGESAPLGRLEESAILAWLEQIGETDAETIAETLERCRDDLDARAYFLRRADEISERQTAQPGRIKTPAINFKESQNNEKLNYQAATLLR